MANLSLKSIIATIALASPALADCSGTSGPCEIAAGSYNIKLPRNHNAQTPVVIFLHGYGAVVKALLTAKKSLTLS